MKRCVKCLHNKTKPIIAGYTGQIFIVQCCHCGFNVSADSQDEAVKMWNGFKVWNLVSKRAKQEI